MPRVKSSPQRTTIFLPCLAALFGIADIQANTQRNNSPANQNYTHYLNASHQLEYSATESLLQDGALTLFVEVLPEDTHFLNHRFWQMTSQFVDFAKDIDYVNQKLHIVVTKAQYQIKLPIEFFSEQKLKDLDFNKAWSGSSDLEKLNADTFRKASSGTNPGYDQTMDVYIGTNDISQKVPSFLELNKNRGAPERVRYIRNTNYTKILGKKTSYSNQMITSFFRSKSNPEETIVIEDAVTYLYNVPPAIAGGVERLRRGIEDAFLNSTKNLDQIARIQEKVI